jgi:thioredoxin 1
MATALTKDNFAAQTKEGVALIDFWAPWCGPCKMQLPIVEELAKELEGKALIAKVNVDEEPELASQFGVLSIPTLVVLKDGVPVDKMVGLQGKEALKQRVENHL